MRSIALALFACITGCGTSNAPATGDTADASTGGGPVGTIPGNPGNPGPGVDAGALAATCSGLSAQPLDAVWSLPAAAGSDAGARTVRVHVPASYDPTKAMPVVLDFHGYTSNATQENLLDAMTAKGDAAGFVTVQPEGLDSSWNAGACCGTSAANGVDDVGFVGAILDTLEAKLCVDTKRIFATGMSNGGFLTHRLGCEVASRIAAIAPVAAVLGVPACTPSRPIAVLRFHGTADDLVPYAGSTQYGFISVADDFAGWAKRDACVGDPVETFNKGDAKCSTYASCAEGTEVTLCTITGGGHAWPGGFPIPNEPTSTSISATDTMWTFFQAHPMK